MEPSTGLVAHIAAEKGFIATTKSPVQPVGTLESIVNIDPSAEFVAKNAAKRRDVASEPPVQTVLEPSALEPPALWKHIWLTGYEGGNI
ncbi:hypothetical protein BDW69DRAFT_190608 [Aspergillus filifer]